MQYIIYKGETLGETYCSVNVKNIDGSVVYFPATVGNPEYDQFLEQAQLTDKQVHNLTPDKWYNFPEGDK